MGDRNDKSKRMETRNETQTRLETARWFRSGTSTRCIYMGRKTHNYKTENKEGTEMITRIYVAEGKQFWSFSPKQFLTSLEYAFKINDMSKLFDEGKQINPPYSHVYCYKENGRMEWISSSKTVKVYNDLSYMGNRQLTEIYKDIKARIQGRKQ